MADMAQSPAKTDEEKQCLERIAEINCADILRQVIYSKVGRSECPLFCRELSEKCTSFSSDQRKLLCAGNIDDFNATLCVKVIRQMEGINPMAARWKSKPDDNNHTLFASLQRMAQFIREVCHCPSEGELNFQQLFRLVSTAFEDIQTEMAFKRDFRLELRDATFTPVLYRLSSQIEEYAVREPLVHEDEVEYSFLDRYSPERHETIKEKIRLVRRYQDRFPPELKAPQVDVMVVYSSHDYAASENFRRSIDGRVLTPKNRKQEIKVKAILYDDAQFWKSEMKTVDVAYENSTYAFLYLTKSFVDSDYHTLVAESLLMESIENKAKQWRVVPVYTSPRRPRLFKVPLGINALKGVNAWNPNEFYWRQLDSLLCDKIHEREDREMENLDKQYEEALKIQDNDKKGLALMDSVEKLSLQHTQPNQDRPVTDKDG